MSEPEDPADATLVANAWQQFQTRILPAAVDHPTQADADLARLSFYFGAYAVFGILSAVIDGAESEDAVDLARSALADELDDFLGNQEAELH